ncbi:MAG: hypothetical protein RIC16_07340 [Rhodospirillales bacterium]
MLKLFNRGKNPADEPPGDPVDIHWVRNNKGRFHNIIRLDTVSEGLRDRGGVYVLFHGGIKPEWLYVGFSSDLGRQIDPLIDDPRLEEYYNRGGVYVTWAFVADEFRHGIVRYMTEKLKPLLDNPAARPLCKGPDRVVPIAVYAPGREPHSDHAA